MKTLLALAAGTLAVLAVVASTTAPADRSAPTERAQPLPSGEIASSGEPSAPDVVPAVAPIPNTLSGTVSDVIDGDTIKVRFLGGEVETVRLIGVDTPETVDPRKEVQCFGAEASAETKRLSLNKRVRLEYDHTQGDRDKYDRLLAYVFVDSDINPGAASVNLAERLIARGFAHEYTYNKPYKYQSVFKAAELEARAGQVGLWAPAACPETAITPPTTAQPAVAPGFIQPPAGGGYTGAYDPLGPDRDCGDFNTQSQAQAFFEAAGGPASDRHRLDRDKDGRACEAD